MESRVGGGRCRTRILLQVPRYFFCKNRPRAFTRQDLAWCWWVKISCANSYLISLNPESPAQLNFLLTILFWLIWSWSGSGLEGSFTATACRCC